MAVKGECTCHQRSQRANDIELNFTHYVLAIVYLLVADFDAACKLFKQVREQDPCSLEHMDTYSNILYVKVSVKMFKGSLIFFFRVDRQIETRRTICHPSSLN